MGQKSAHLLNEDCCEILEYLGVRQERMQSVKHASLKLLQTNIEMVGAGFGVSCRRATEEVLADF